MKTILLVISILFINISVQAQKYVNAKKVKIPYVQYPTDHSLQNFSNYYVQFDGYMDNRSTIEQIVDMPGFQKLGSRDNADFLIIVSQSFFDVSSAKRNSSKKTRKKKDGTTESWIEYSYSSSINCEYYVKIVQNDGTILDSRSGTFTSTFRGTEYRDESAARNAYETGISKEKKRAIKTAFLDAFNKMKENYCFINQTVYGSFVGFKFKKNDYSDLNDLSEIATATLKKDVSNETRIEMNGYIEKWSAELENFVADDKKARINKKIKAGLYFNIMVAYFYMEDFVNAFKYVTLTQEINKTVQNGQYTFHRVSKRNVKSIENQ